MAAHGGDGLDGLLHLHIDDAHDAFRRILDAQAQRLGDGVLQRIARGLRVERHLAAEKIAGAQIAQHQIAIGDGGLGSPAHVAGGAGHGAGALGAHHQLAETVHMGQRAAARAHRVDVDHGQGHVAPLHLAAIGDGGLAIPDERHIAGGAAHVEGDEVLHPRGAAGVDAGGNAACGARKHGGDGLFRCGLEGRHAAVGLHDVFLRRGDACPLQAGVEIVDIARQNGLQIGVDDRGREPIIFADLRHDLAGERHAATGNLFGQNLAHALFMLRREEGEEQAYRDGLHILLAQRARRFAQGLFVQRFDNFAFGGHALGGLAGAAGRHEHGRAVIHDVEDGGAVGARLLGHFIDAAKALGDDEAGAHALAFEQRVGADRGAMAEIADVLGQDAPRDQFLHARQNGAGGIVGGRGNLGDGDLAGLVVHIDEIRKCAARIHGQTIMRHPSRFLPAAVRRPKPAAPWRGGGI